jgi:hypothetical protein
MYSTERKDADMNSISAAFLFLAKVNNDLGEIWETWAIVLCIHNAYRRLLRILKIFDSGKLKGTGPELSFYLIRFVSWMYFQLVNRREIFIMVSKAKSNDESYKHTIFGICIMLLSFNFECAVIWAVKD